MKKYIFLIGLLLIPYIGHCELDITGETQGSGGGFDADKVDGYDYTDIQDYIYEVATALGSRYYMYQDTDSGTSYKLCLTSASSDTTETYTKASLSNYDYIMGWISPAGVEFDKMIEGWYDWKVYAAKTAGTKTLRIFWSLYERKSDGSEIWISSSATSGAITTKDAIRLFLSLSADYEVTSGSRIVGKIYASVTGGGSAPTIALYYEGDEDSHWEIPTNTELLDATFATDAEVAAATSSISMAAYLPLAGGTMSGTLDMNVNIIDNVSTLNADDVSVTYGLTVGTCTINNGYLVLGSSGTALSMRWYDIDFSTQSYRMEIKRGVLTLTKE